MAFNCCRNLGHLHETHDSFLHTGSTRGGEENNWQLFDSRILIQASNFFTYNCTHRSHDKVGIHNPKSHSLTFNKSSSCHNSFIQTRFFTHGCQFLLITREMQGILTFNPCKQFFESPHINRQSQAFLGRNTKGIATVRTDTLTSQILLINGMLTTWTLRK